MRPLLSFLTPTAPKTAVALGGVLIVVLCVTFGQYQELKTERAKYAAAQTALQNPKVVTVIKTVTTVGPMRVVYRTIEKPTGETETITEETRDGYTREETSDTKKEPVAVGALIPVAGRANRWLLTFGVNRLSEDFDGKGILGGYGWNNRLDVQAGALHTARESTGWLFVTARF